MSALDQLIVDLFRIGAIHFTTDPDAYFTLKSGQKSPIYVDIRKTFGHPKLLKQICEHLWEQVKDPDDIDLIAGVAYGALPIASWLSIEHEKPLIFKRKEKKKHGIASEIDGQWEFRDTCVVFEDVITTGQSTQDLINSLESNGIQVVQVITFLNRKTSDEQKANLLNFSSVVDLKSIFEILLGHRMIDGFMYRFLVDNISGRQEQTKVSEAIAIPKEKPIHPFRKKLKDIINEKQTNLILSADLTSYQKVLDIAKTLGPYICGVKIHIDLLGNFHDKQELIHFVKSLKQIAMRHCFIIIEDRKFSDIGHTVSKQFQNGFFEINKWADAITVHSVGGPGVLESIRKVNPEMGVIIVAEMSSQGNLIDRNYTQKTIEMAAENSDLVIGLVLQHVEHYNIPKNLLIFTPGISINRETDEFDQTYSTPAKKMQAGTDLLIVGRDLYESKQPIAVAERYQNIFRHRTR